jgi:hypothetical protein
MADVSIVDETDGYLNLSGLLYSFVSLKELPDATFPGVLRELIGLDFPIIVNAQISIPDQAKVLKGYKGRLRKMQAAQKDANGGDDQPTVIMQYRIQSLLKSIRVL